MVLADRTSLYRAGIFSDWEGLAYALSEPRTHYELTTSGGAPDRSGIAPCVWTTMTTHAADQPVSRICWSTGWGLPLSIQTRRGDDWVTQFAITEARIFEPSDAVFQIDTAGYVEMDARAGDDSGKTVAGALVASHVRPSSGLHHTVGTDRSIRSGRCWATTLPSCNASPTCWLTP